MPARNEADRLGPTIRSFAETRFDNVELEFVVVDDASEDGCCFDLVYESPKIEYPGVSVKVIRFNQRLGVPRARNEGAAIASGEYLFITDAHVQVSEHWDRYLLENVRDNLILATTVTEAEPTFKAYGCRLAVPFMGTWWNREPLNGLAPVQIATTIGTILKRDLFWRIGAYDQGMKLYAGAEPEFSVRAWLSGAEIVCVPEINVKHRFKPTEERDQFLKGLRPYMTHNSLRFGICYLSEPAILQLLRYFALKFPVDAQKAFALLNGSDVWQRRDFLSSSLRYDFDWFIRRFNLKDQLGRNILLEESVTGPAEFHDVCQSAIQK
jgi:glycosyltransferase involved in cell wall biosynthesis